MNVQELKDKAETDDHQTLNERDAKQLLKLYGVPVVREMTARDVKTALAAAEEMGYPVVLKGFGTTLQHKTERGLVHLNLCDAQSVTMAVESIMAEAGQELEGLLIQPCLTGRREFVAGVFRDDLFGPVVMFGLGGIFTEAVHDVSLRLAPLSPSDAEEMLNGINAQAMLGNFRGEAGVDRSSIKQVLMGLSRLAMEEPDIAEVDINPIIADATGKITAVDALVCFRKQKKNIETTVPVDYHRINQFFYPESIAFIGASSKFGKWGFLLPLSSMSWDYKGKIWTCAEKLISKYNYLKI